MRVLSIDGGGFLGLATASFLAESERHFQVKCHDQFQLFCGTSTGAIIALGLALGLSGRDVVDLYKAFGPSVFWNPLPGVRFLRKWVRGWFMPMYNNGSLREKLREVFGETTLGDLRGKGKCVVVPAFSITSGKPRIFKTNHADNLTMHDEYRLWQIALASSAAPAYLPVVQLPSPVGGFQEQFCDGGVFANHPALIGYTEAVHHLCIPPCRVRLLSVSTPRADLAEHGTTRGCWQRYLLHRGVLGWANKIGGIFIDGTSEICHEALRRIVNTPGNTEALYERIRLKKPSGTDLDVATRHAIETLQKIGTETAAQEAVRQQVKPFFDKNGV